jgi:hypothetical protein
MLSTYLWLYLHLGEAIKLEIIQLRPNEVLVLPARGIKPAAKKGLAKILLALNKQFVLCDQFGFLLCA